MTRTTKRMSAVDILKKLSTIAPDVDIKTIWTEDPHYTWDGDGPDPADEGYIPCDVRVRAAVIVDGLLVEGDNLLGGCYEKPGRADPDVHGYFAQMVDEALRNVPVSSRGKHAAQIAKALKFLSGVHS